MVQIPAPSRYTGVEDIVTFVIEDLDCVDAEGTAFELILRVVEELDI